MPTISVGGAQVAYSTAGSGPALVLVAGTGLPAQLNFGHLVDAFAPHRTVVLPDYSGSGDTVDDGGLLTLDLLADQIAAVAEAVGGPVDLLGYSLGAPVSVTLAANRPGLVRRLVLLNGWPGPDARDQLMFEVWSGLEQTDHDLFTRFLQLACFSPTFLSALGPDGVRQLIDAAPPIGPGMRRHIALDGSADVTALLPKVTAETLVVGGRRDFVVPVERSRALHEAIAGSQFVELDCGHLSVFEKAPELVDVVSDFLFAPGNRDAQGA